ncbi:MAG: PilT protein domain protein, partial [Verrucomicrobiales bacterium]|nr:PilT protein domain protein [Verrucomicrobiales bacterium]
HAFLWFISGDNALTGKARILIEDELNENLISAATLWEIGIKNSLGKLPLSKPFGELIAQQLSSAGDG